MSLRYRYSCVPAPDQNNPYDEMRFMFIENGVVLAPHYVWREILSVVRIGSLFLLCEQFFKFTLLCEAERFLRNVCVVVHSYKQTRCKMRYLVLSHLTSKCSVDENERIRVMCARGKIELHLVYLSIKVYVEIVFVICSLYRKSLIERLDKFSIHTWEPSKNWKLKICFTKQSWTGSM